MPNIFIITKEIRTKNQYGFVPIAAFESEKEANRFFQKQIKNADKEQKGVFTSSDTWFRSSEDEWERISLKRKEFSKMPDRIYLTQEEINQKGHIVCLSKITSSKVNDEDTWIPVNKKKNIFDYSDLILTIILLVCVVAIPISSFFKLKSLAMFFSGMIICLLVASILVGIYYAFSTSPKNEKGK